MIISHSDKRWNHIRLMTLTLLFLMSIARATDNESVNITNATQQKTQLSINLPIFIPDNPISGTLTSLWQEYIRWGITNAKTTISELKSAYNLSSMYDLPFFGPIFVGIWLLLSGHLGALLYLAQSTLVFTLVGMIAVDLLIGSKLRMFIPLPYISDFLIGILAALLAIGLATLM
jgi:hypothetical protein